MEAVQALAMESHVCHLTDELEGRAPAPAAVEQTKEAVEEEEEVDDPMALSMEESLQLDKNPFSLSGMQPKTPEYRSAGR